MHATAGVHQCTHDPGHLLQAACGCVIAPTWCPLLHSAPQPSVDGICCIHCRWLLGSIVVLGLVHGVAFSASYQMVSRFANKNTISLGLGCVGSGLLVLFIEVAMQLGPKPSRMAGIILFELVAGGAPPSVQCLRSLCSSKSMLLIRLGCAVSQQRHS